MRPMDSPHRTGPGAIVWLLMQGGLVAGRRLASALEAHGLGPLDGVMLRLAARSAEPALLALARECGITGSTAVGVVDRLEHAGLVRRERDREDRRVVRVQVTDVGRRVVAELPATAADLERELTEGLSATERDALRGLLTRVMDGIDARSPGLVHKLRAEQLSRMEGLKVNARGAGRPRRRRGT